MFQMWTENFSEKLLKTDCYCYANHANVNNNVFVNMQRNTRMAMLWLMYFKNNDLVLFFWTAQQGWEWKPETAAVPI